MKNFYVVLFSVVLVVFLESCEKDKNSKADNFGYSKGIYIINEGSYNSNNGSISFIDPDSNKIMNNIFEIANNRPVGDILQSFTVVNDTIGFAVVNNSAKVEIMGLSTFKVISDPILVNYPRYFQQVSTDKGYLSAGSFQGYLYVIDLNLFEIIDSIKVGFGPENMMMLDNKVYVANSGGWGSDSTISVIQTESDWVEDTIHTADCPIDLVKDENNNIWVLCKGYTNYTTIETDAYLQKIDSETGSILWQSKIGTALDYSSTPARCAVSPDGSVIYYTRPEGVFEIHAENPSIAQEPLIAGNFYGLDVNPKDGNIYVFEASFSGNGSVKIFSPQGELISEGMVGIGPNGAVFNY